MSKERNIFVLDIETVRDFQVLGADWPSNKWPLTIGWKIVAIGLLVASIRGDGDEASISVAQLGCITGDEREILEKFWTYFSNRDARVVTWNGRSFDLPVIIHRSLVHSIPAPRWFQAGDRYNGYQYRYGADWHCDLMDQLSDYGASTKMGLDLVAKALGFPGKPGVSGADVEPLFEAGRIDEIKAYCETDVINLYGVYLRWCLLTGRIGVGGQDEAIADLQTYLGNGNIEHRVRYAEDWNQAKLTVETQVGPLA